MNRRMFLQLTAASFALACGDVGSGWVEVGSMMLMPLVLASINDAFPMLVPCMTYPVVL